MASLHQQQGAPSCAPTRPLADGRSSHLLLQGCDPIFHGQEVPEMGVGLWISLVEGTYSEAAEAPIWR
jgi:hypothetical protein